MFEIQGISFYQNLTHFMILGYVMKVIQIYFVEVVYKIGE